MTKVKLINTVLLLLIIPWLSPFKKERRLIIPSQNIVIIVSIQSLYFNKLDNDIIYCCIEGPEMDFRKVLYGKYNSQYDFYDTLQVKCKTKFIYSHGVQYWKNFCRTGFINFSDKSNKKDSVLNASIRSTLINKKNYLYTDIVFARNKNKGLHIGVGHVSNIDYCKTFAKEHYSFSLNDTLLVLTKPLKFIDHNY